MKNLTKMALLASIPLTMCGLASCTNEGINQFDRPGSSTPGLIAKAPEFNAYSGQHVWRSTGTRSNAGDGGIDNQIWARFEDPKNITADEREAVLKALDEKTTGQRISEDIVFPWENYFLQDVVSANQTDTPSKSYDFEAWNMNPNLTTPCPAEHNGDHANYEFVTDNGNISKYRQHVNADGSQERIDKTALMTDMYVGGGYEDMYEKMAGKQFRWYINCHENLHWSEYIVVEVDGSYYICFDFACGFKEHDIDGTPGRGNTQNDWDYNDWIIKISPAMPKGSTPDDGHPETGINPNPTPIPGIWRSVENGGPQNPTTPEGPTTPGNPGDDGNDDTDVDNPGEDQPGNDQPDVNVPSKLDKHVEVNLSVNDALDFGDYISAHLSIHVRAVTDVEIFIPVSAEYYCKSDDMEIVLSHKEELFAYGDKKGSIKYNVGGKDVTLEVTYEPNGIRVKTTGIDQSVIDYCRQNFGDGITFEVWTYFNNTLNRNELKPMFDDSEVSFTQYENVDYYINAFNKIGDGPNPWDCTVTITESQSGYFGDAIQGNHYNGSPYNWIYSRKKDQ